MLDVQRVRQRGGRFDQRASGFGIGRRRAAIHAEGQRDQRVAEQAAPDLGQRQDAGYCAGTLGDQVVCAMAKDVLDDVPPADAVKERRFGTALDEFFPRGGIGCDEGPHADAVGRASDADDFAGRRFHHVPPFRKTRSTLSQRKSARRLFRRGSVRSRFR